MTRTVGVVARGIRTPIIKQGDDLEKIVTDSILKSLIEENYCLKNGDILGITESLLARAQGNYASIEQIAKAIDSKFKGNIALLFPILSRNRFSLILKSIALTERKIYLFLNYPTDEVGNVLMDKDTMYELGINPHSDILSEKEYRELFGKEYLHPFTKVDYVRLYKDFARDNNIEIYLSNDPKQALVYAKEVLVASIHDRLRIKSIVTKAGGERVLCLDEILNESVDGSGFNPEYGLLGSNTASKTLVKLFPRDSQRFVNSIQRRIKKETGKLIEVLVYGDGAFKDPQGKIWELADPVVSPGYTDGLRGLPNEIKLKYIADNELMGLKEEDAKKEIIKRIKNKKYDIKNQTETIGTTPRQITDLLGSLCDLISGSGDKGTPIVLIQGYFDNYASE